MQSAYLQRDGGVRRGRRGRRGGGEEEERRRRSVSVTTPGRMIYHDGNAAPVFWCPACPNAFRSSHQL